MEEYKDFSDFKEAVIKELKEKRPDVSGLAGGMIAGAAGVGVGGGILLPGLGSIVGKMLGGECIGKTIPDLNTLMFDDFLEKNYKERFEKSKGKPSSVRMLIAEAVEQIIKQKIDEKNN